MSDAGIGHNSGEVDSGPLRAFCERIERLSESIGDLQDDRKEIFSEARSCGFDVTAIRQIIKIRAEDRDKRREREEILAIYLSALGME
jgi:uncharacterized protein (UPF0335 family)